MLTDRWPRCWPIRENCLWFGTFNWSIWYQHLEDEVRKKNLYRWWRLSTICYTSDTLWVLDWWLTDRLLTHYQCYGHSINTLFDTWPMYSVQYVHWQLTKILADTTVDTPFMTHDRWCLCYRSKILIRCNNLIILTCNIYICDNQSLKKLKYMKSWLPWGIMWVVMYFLSYLYPFLTFSVVILLFYSIWWQNSFCLNFDKYLYTAPLTWLPLILTSVWYVNHLHPPNPPNLWGRRGGRLRL